MSFFYAKSRTCSFIVDQLIYQINHSYANNCYDAAAVLMRRLFEVLLVLSYQNNGIDDQIKDSTGKGYIMLDGIVLFVRVYSDYE